MYRVKGLVEENAGLLHKSKILISEMKSLFFYSIQVKLFEFINIGQNLAGHQTVVCFQ